ncbi:MAG: FkbM family methyltransferase [Patescibacteria group bacterium]
MLKKIKEIIRQVLPPFIYKILVIFSQEIGLTKKEESKYLYKPECIKIQKGILKDRDIILDTHDNNWQIDIINGTYDKFFFDYLNKLNFTGNIIFDIGAHIGYHSMAFASMVGDNGKVFSFEPNKSNIQRFQQNLDKNIDLKKIIKLNQIALSDKSGFIDFWCSEEIDNGYSSGGFINGSSTPDSMDHYLINGFKKEKVPTITFDEFVKNSAINQINMIKIDVEGSEYAVLQGAIKSILKFKPILMMEIHSIKNMYDVFSLLTKNGYNLKLLDENQQDHRCFFVADSTK